MSSPTESTTAMPRIEDSPQQLLSAKLNQAAISQINHTLGVLLTQAEATLEGPKLKAYKSLLRREMYNLQNQYTSTVWGVIQRAEVSSFREHPTLEEQSQNPPRDVMDFSEALVD